MPRPFILASALLLSCAGQQPNDGTVSPAAPQPGASTASPAGDPGGSANATMVDGVKPAADPTPPANPAPDFTLSDLDGNQMTLSGLRGKIVVLEWFNPGCPFVRYAHGEGPLRDLAARHIANGVTWLAINSSAPGKQGHGVELNRKAQGDWKMGHPILIDEKGTVGRAYNARTTPLMVVIDARGSIAYRGALDNAPLGKVPSEGHQNFVDLALAAVAAGRPVDVAETKSYGCSVKYSD